MELKQKSLWNKEIHFTIRKSVQKVCDALPFCLAAICLLVCMLHPLPVTIYALQKRSIDFPFLLYNHLARDWLYPIMLYSGGLALVLGAVKYRSAARFGWKRNPPFLLFSLLCGWMLLSQTVNGWDDLARRGTESMGGSVYVEIGYFMLLFPLCALIITSRCKRTLLRLFLFVSAFLSAVAFPLWKTQVISTIIKGWQPAFTCIHINTNYYGYYLTVAVSLSVAMLCAEETPLWKGFSALCLVLNTVALSYNSTMGAWVGSFFACLFLIVALRIRDGRFSFWAWVSFGIFLGAMLVTGTINGCLSGNLNQLGGDLFHLMSDVGSEESMHAGSGRWIIWVRCAELIKAHPWFGLGFECVVAKGIEGYTTNNRPHNEFLEYALFYGIPAAILYFAGCFSVFLRALKYKAQLDNYTLAALTAAFGYLVGSFFGLTVYNTAPYLFIMLGLGYVHVAESAQPSNTLRSKQ